jgi:hypothetical protein
VLGIPGFQDTLVPRRNYLSTAVPRTLLTRRNFNYLGILGYDNE